MNDPSPVKTGYTRKYQIPLSHLEHDYIHRCTDGSELEQIYKELIGGQEGLHTILAQFTLDRIRSVLPDSSLLRANSSQIDKSTPVINNPQNGIASPPGPDAWKNFQDNIAREFDSYEETSSTNSQSHELNKRLHLAAQHRLNASAALKLNQYQQSIDSYTNSIALEQDPSAYLQRAIAYSKIDNFDASIQDCSHVLSLDSRNADVLMQRARCYLATQQYDRARQDLNLLLSIDPGNIEIEDLMNTLIALEKSELPPTSISSIIQDHADNTMMTDSIPPGNSPSEFDHQNIDHFHAPLSHDDDDMALGDEAGAGAIEGNLSDDEGRVSRSFNVSPTIDEGPDTHILTTPQSFSDPIDQSIALGIDNNNPPHHHHQPTNEDDERDLYDYPNSSSSGRNTLRNNNQTYSQDSSNFDAIASSDFGSIVQSWLRDLIALQSTRRYYDRPWSRSPRPWSLDKIQRDVEKFHRFNEYRNAIDVSKKMLRNGVLDYHHHAEYLSETLIGCARCYFKFQDYPQTIQYATEALQYNRNDGNALRYRARAFENGKFLLFSYADYARVPTSDFDYDQAQRACEKLTIELNSTEGKNWREKLPNDQNDDERCLSYLKQTTNYSEKNSFEWHQTHADQFCQDACFVLAIRFYTVCIELQPEMKDVYLKRAACYLKVFEPQKVISDCEMVLKKDESHFLALYYKAAALKIATDYRAYELALKECIKLQPNNQIILAEYYTYRHMQIPRKKRRIRTRSTDENQLSYEELEQIRAEKINRNASVDSSDIREQCSLILHLQSFDALTRKLLEMIVNSSRTMIQAEEVYQQEHPSSVLPFSYSKFCLDVLLRLAKAPQLDSVLAMVQEKHRVLLDELVSYYSTKSDDVEELNRLKRL